MPFTIEMRAPVRELPERENLELAAELRRTFPSIEAFPLDHDLIARRFADVPRDQVLNHWAQLELHGDESIGHAIITLWLDAAYIELTSTPPTSCEEWLVRVAPVLALFRDRGFAGPSVGELLPAYKRQREAVRHVAGLVRGAANE
jgi:hypothetical protein